MNLHLRDFIYLFLKPGACSGGKKKKKKLLSPLRYSVVLTVAKICRDSGPGKKTFFYLNQ